MTSSGRAALCALAIALAPVTVFADGMEPVDSPLPQTRELALPADVIGATWEWVSFITPKKQIDVDDPSRYTLELAGDGSAALQVDCNRGVSQYTLDADNRISFGPIGVTMMLCPDDQLGHRFTTELERVNSWFQQDGEFLLELPMDSGTLRFREAP
jgi:heat shock protein HslJ